MQPSIKDIYAARVTAGDLRADPAQAAALPLLDALRSALQAPAPRRGFFARARAAPLPGLSLWGGVGRGKSMLMDLFCEATEVPRRRVHFHAFMQEVQARLNEVRKAGTADAIRPVAEAVAADLRLLCLDEMQITDIADAMIVGRLFQYLSEAGVTVVTTSNRAPDDLYRNGLNRQLFLPFIELIKARMTVHELRSPTDYRQHRLAGQKVYFSPAGAEARAAIDAIWAGLTGGEAAPLRLVVNGRDVVLARARDGAARAAFWDLCGKPLGPADYLAIAGALRVLVIEDIPYLSASNYNEARRFVTLIDALYEAKVRLVCSAADVPERLYTEGEGSFEFERTASRLREMQAAGWGQDGTDDGHDGG